jgi:hypothetical protein
VGHNAIGKDQIYATGVDDAADGDAWNRAEWGWGEFIGDEFKAAAVDGGGADDAATGKQDPSAGDDITDFSGASYEVRPYDDSHPPLLLLVPSDSKGYQLGANRLCEAVHTTPKLTRYNRMFSP